MHTAYVSEPFPASAAFLSDRDNISFSLLFFFIRQTEIEFHRDTVATGHCTAAFSEIYTEAASLSRLLGRPRNAFV